MNFNMKPEYGASKMILLDMAPTTPAHDLQHSTVISNRESQLCHCRCFQPIFWEKKSHECLFDPAQ